MPLIDSLTIRRQAAQTIRAHLLKSVAIVQCCRIIMVEKILETPSDVEKYTRALELAQEALKVASDKHTEEQVIDSVYREAIAAITSVKGLHPDSLINIQTLTKSAKSKDTDVQATRSSILKRLKEYVAPNFKVDVRVRADIKEERSQNASEVPCRKTDTLDIVLLTMVVRTRNPLRLSDNPHFYDKSFDDIANVCTVPKSALPFDSVLSSIPLARNSKLLYCLLDHKSGSFILLRSVKTQRFANIWRVDVSGKYILKENIGDLHSADWIINHILIHDSDVKIVKTSIPTDPEGSSEVRKDTWLKVFEEVCKAFKETGYTWTIEVNSAQRVPQSDPSSPVQTRAPESSARRVPQSNPSSPIQTRAPESSARRVPQSNPSSPIQTRTPESSARRVPQSNPSSPIQTRTPESSARRVPPESNPSSSVQTLAPKSNNKSRSWFQRAKDYLFS